MALRNMMKKNMGCLIGGLLVIATLFSPPFHSYLLFLVMNGLVLVNAIILYSNLKVSSRYLDGILGVAVIALTQITVTELYPGLFGFLSLTQVVFTQIGCLSLTLIAVWGGWLHLPVWQDGFTKSQMAIQEMAGVCGRHTAGLVACMSTGFAFVYVFAVSALNPPISIDSIFFHLMQPVYWLQTGQIPIKLMENYAYPHGTGLIYLWALFPFNHDFIARFSQLPFIMLGAFACYGICRILDMPRVISAVTAMAVLTMPAFLANGIALTDPDTQMAGTALVSLYFALSLARNYQFSTVLLLGLALGQLLNSKYNSVYYGVPLILLVIYAWGAGLKKAGPSHILIFIKHGLILFILPIGIGGIAYIYQLYDARMLLPFEGYLTSSTYVPQFSLWRFFTSEQSFKDLGLTGLISLFIGVGIIKNIGQAKGRQLILPIFVLLPLCFSLTIYVLYGYYEGAQAIRHLLATLALCIILAGWGAHQLNEPWRKYGLWAILFFIMVDTGLAVWRQWFIHQLHTNLLSLLAGLFTAFGIWLLLRAYRQTGLWPMWFRRYVVSLPGLLGLICIGLWSLHGWEWAYRDMKYARWPPKFGFGTGWGFVGELTKEKGARIAYNVAPYPILGYDIENTLIHVMPDISSLQLPRIRQEKLMQWEHELQQQHIDVIYLMAIGRNATSGVDNVAFFFDTITSWMQERSTTFKSIYIGSRESIFMVQKQKE